MQGPKGLKPFIVCKEELGHMAGHDGQVNPGSPDAEYVAFDPLNEIPIRTAPCNFEHRRGGVNSDDP